HHGVLRDGCLEGGAVNCGLRQIFSDALGCKVLVNNDRRPLALAEKKFGCARETDYFTVVNLGTGCGISHFEERLMYGGASLSGELFPLRQWVPQLGGYETVNNLLGGAGVAALYHKLSNGKRLSTTETFARSSSDEVARKVIEIFVDQLAFLLEQISYFYNPELIVLNGSLIRSADVFFDRMLELYRTRTFAYSRAVRIILSQLEHANCLGAVCE
ncbi:MAG: ROK family protein, partial [Oligoflexia bacterium]|nr:ROK family protein [Oligoflexia bacterium]